MTDVPPGFFLALTIFLGLALGSFATALAYRLPRDLSIWRKTRSACPHCGRQLTVADLVPVFSWLFLKGKCRSCKKSIGLEYPLIELATLLLCLAFYARFGFTTESLCLFALAPVITGIIAIDLRFKIIPDGLNISIFALGVAALVATSLQAPDAPAFLISKGGESLLGALLYTGAALALRFGVMAVLKRDPLGWGDIKFFAAAGFWLGLNPDSGAYLLLVSGIAGIALALIWRRLTGEREFPFGPALLLGFTAMLLWQGPGFLLT